MASLTPSVMVVWVDDRLVMEDGAILQWQPASAFKEASSSLCFVPPDFDCGEGDDLTPCLGSVDRDECISGVPPRLPDASSFCRCADKKLFVEATASAWDVAWYICQESFLKKTVTTKTNEDYTNILDHPSWLRYDAQMCFAPGFSDKYQWDSQLSDGVLS